MAKRRANGEGSIFKRSDGKWAAQYTDSAGKKKTLYGKTQQEVKQKLKEAIRQVDMGMSSEKIAFGAWLAEWLQVYVKPTCQGGTFAGYYNIFHNHVIPAFPPELLLKDLRADMLQRFFNEKARGGRIDGKEGGFSYRTLQMMKRLITSALTQAVDNKILVANPAKTVKLSRQKWSEVEVLSKADQKRLEKVLLESDSLTAFPIYFDLYTGLRVGELLGLRVSDIDYEEKALYVRRSFARVQDPETGTTSVEIHSPKTHKGNRCIPIPGFIFDKLVAHIKSTQEGLDKIREYQDEICPEYYRGWLKQDYIFVNAFGKPHESAYMRKSLDGFLNKAGIEHIKFHALRHTFATRCIESGMDIRSLADILGHADASVTLNTYTHSLPEQKRSGMDNLANILDDEESEK